MYKAIIDIKRLNIVKRFCNKKELLDLDKRLNELFTGLSKDSLKLLSLIDRFDKLNSLKSSYKNYTIGKRKVHVIRSEDELKNAIKEINREKIIGFDTEQKPTFKRGESQKQIAIVQIATKQNCYIIQMINMESINKIKKIICDPKILKVGFGLSNDNKQLTKLFGAPPESLFDISTFIKSNIIPQNALGAKNAVALFLSLILQKSKNAALSNWEKDDLTSGQLKYATEDATAPLDVYYEIKKEYNYLSKLIK